MGGGLSFVCSPDPVPVWAVDDVLLGAAVDRARAVVFGQVEVGVSVGGPGAAEPVDKHGPLPWSYYCRSLYKFSS